MIIEWIRDSLFSKNGRLYHGLIMIAIIEKSDWSKITNRKEMVFESAAT